MGPASGVLLLLLGGVGCLLLLALPVVFVYEGRQERNPLMIGVGIILGIVEAAAIIDAALGY